MELHIRYSELPSNGHFDAIWRVEMLTRAEVLIHTEYCFRNSRCKLGLAVVVLIQPHLSS